MAALETTKIERTKILADETGRLTFNLTKPDMENLAWVVDYLSHVVPGGAHGQVFGKVLADYRKAKSSPKSNRAACQYKDPKSGRICGSTYQVESDHIVPRALGGPDDERNLRCLCKRHNLMMAREWLGPE